MSLDRARLGAWLGDGTLYGHAPEVQVSRWGLPLITHVFLSDPALKDEAERYNRATPADDVTLLSKQSATLQKK